MARSTFAATLRRTLLECVATGELVAIHKWDDAPDIFHVAVLHEVDGDVARGVWVDTDGRDDGETTASLADIARVHRASEYLASLQALRDDPDGAFPSPRPRSEVRSPRSVRAALRQAHATGEGIRIYVTPNDDYDGFVREVGRDHLVFEDVAEGGQSDGVWVVRLADVTRVRRDSYGQAIEYLHRRWRERRG